MLDKAIANAASSPPVYTAGRVPSTMSFTVGQSVNYTLPATTFTDANNDPLTYSVSALPAGLSFTASTRTISGTPTTLGNNTKKGSGWATPDNSDG